MRHREFANSVLALDCVVRHSFPGGLHHRPGNTREGAQRPQGLGQRQGFHNEALMRGAGEAQGGAAWLSSEKSPLPRGSPSTRSPLRASSGHQDGCPPPGSPGPVLPCHHGPSGTAARNPAFPCNNANVLITISSICMKKDTRLAKPHHPGSGLGIHKETNSSAQIDEEGAPRGRPIQGGMGQI